MSVGRQLRLLVDPPYPGESTSSFLGRTAQAYRVSLRELVKELVPDARPGRDLRDMDRWPHEPLMEALAHAVPGWKKGDLRCDGLNRWCISPRSRRAYCPLCFVEDLGAGRTPYFRLDWAAVVTVCCWRHHSPLFDWEAIDWAGLRLLPAPWLDAGQSLLHAPPHLIRDHRRATRLLAESETPAFLGGPSLGECFALLVRLQYLFEAPVNSRRAAHSDEVETFWLQATNYCRIAFALLEEGRGLLAGDDARAVRTSHDWLATGHLGLNTAKNFRVYVRRKCSALAWRRYYCLFVAQLLFQPGRARGPFLGISLPEPWARHEPAAAPELEWQPQALARFGRENVSGTLDPP